MDWQQKAAALDALAEISIKCRKVGDWYVLQSVEIKRGSILESACGNGETPEEAVEDHWQQVVNDIIDTEKYLVVRPTGDDRRAVKWNGFMWADVSEPKRVAA